MRVDPIRLSRSHQVWLYLTFGTLFLSGVLWLVFHFYLPKQSEFGMTPNPMEQWWLKVHGAAAMVTLILLGTLLPIHVRRGWNEKRNLITGVTVVALNGVLFLSGYALYYCGGEVVRLWISRLHWILGLALPVILGWHIWRGKLSRKRRDV